MTPEQQTAEVIRMRQAHCKHAFARMGAPAQCVHCGLPESEYTPPPPMFFGNGYYSP